MYYTTKFRFPTKPNSKPNFKTSKIAGEKTRYEMHKKGWYLDFRIVFTPSLKHEISWVGISSAGRARARLWPPGVGVGVVAGVVRLS